MQRSVDDNKGRDFLILYQIQSDMQVQLGQWKWPLTFHWYQYNIFINLKKKKWKAGAHGKDSVLVFSQKVSNFK